MALEQARILLAEDKDLILAFERQRAQTTISDEMEREMQSWTARWRGEALEHYLRSGWCFGNFKGTELQGYILAQPLLFFRGLTQSVWVEHLSFTSQEIAMQLVDTVHKWARDKHLQCVWLEETPEARFVLEQWKQARRIDQPMIEFKSAKY